MNMLLSRSCLAALLFASSCSAFNPAILLGLGMGQRAMGLSTKRSASANSLGMVRCMADKPKLTYFNARGVAETARIMFVAAGVDYEDFRYQMVPQAPGQMPVTSSHAVQYAYTSNGMHKTFLINFFLYVHGAVSFLCP
jgi:hypothetical protein